MDPIAALLSLGLSEYEARAYVALVRNGPLNGYEVAKHSGVPRANVYAALERLERRHVVVAVREGDATRYSARPQAEFIERMRREHDVTFDRATAALARLMLAKSEATVINIRGYDTVLQYAGDAIAAAAEKLLLAVHPRESHELAGLVQAAEERGVDITTLCMSECETECGTCRGRLYRYHVSNLGTAHWLLVVADQLRVVASEIDESDATAIEASQVLIAELAGAYIGNTIALATLAGDARLSAPGERQRPAREPQRSATAMTGRRNR
ncbi:MAG: TrmB family transcriptional regulator [Vulcanimicrobiaceae bacterium]